MNRLKPPSAVTSDAIIRPGPLPPKESRSKPNSAGPNAEVSWMTVAAVP